MNQKDLNLLFLTVIIKLKHKYKTVITINILRLTYAACFH